MVNRTGRDNDGYTTERDGGRHSPNSGKVMDPAHDGRLKENRDDNDRGGNTRTSSSRDTNNRGGNDSGMTTERDGGAHNPNSGQVLHPDTDRRLKENGGDGRGGNNDDDRGGNTRSPSNRDDDRGGNNRGGNHGGGGPHPATRPDDQRLARNRDNNR